MKSEQEDIFEQEVEELIQEIKVLYGYDFNGYTRASLHRRIQRFLTTQKLSSIEAIKGLIFNDSHNFERFLQEITVNVTEMFRDPGFFLSLRQTVLPLLSTYPHIKIWDAGCSTGEELFSLAIVLEEEGLLRRTKIYATDINQRVLKQAKEGVYPSASIAANTERYQASGGKKDFSTYYISSYGSLKFHSSLIKNVVFYPHNLATDSSFNEFHLILCRNVLIYFNRELQERVFGLFDESLASLGYIGLGRKETLPVSLLRRNYALIDKDYRIYRKII